MARRLIAAPGVALDAVYMAPDSEQNQGILSLITAQYITGPTPGNRTVSMMLRDKNNNLVGVFASSFLQVASTTVTYVWGATGTAYQAGDDSVVHIPMQTLEIFGGDTITLPDVGFDSDDAWQNWVLTFVGSPGSEGLV